MEVGIPVLDGRDVIEHLADEMAPEGESALREEVMEIHAAKQGMVLKIDGRVAGSELRDESFAWRMVSVEELEQEDVEQWPFLEHLEDLTNENPVVFTIPPTEHVLAFSRGCYEPRRCRAEAIRGV